MLHSPGRKLREVPFTLPLRWRPDQPPLVQPVEEGEQLVSAHRRNVTLARELRDAERALGDNPSDETLARVIDLKNQLQSIAGTEALEDGFQTPGSRKIGRF